MTIYFKNDNIYRPGSEASVASLKKLPPKSFLLRSDLAGFYFEEIDDFTMPPKLYGETVLHTDRIFNTFMDRPNTTGVLLSGEKGSGKTMQAKHIALHAAKQGIPTIIVNTPYEGDAFNILMQSITQPAVIFCDEFEKIYDNQEPLLTLLEGVFPSKKLFLLTCNNEWKIDSHMINRPGRIFYKISYSSLSARFIQEYCEDNLSDKRYISQIIKLAGVFEKFNFDMLKSIIEEMERYGESPQDALKLLNVQPEGYRNRETNYKVSIAKGGVSKDLYHEQVNVSPLMQEFNVTYYPKTRSERTETLTLRPDMITEISDEGNYTYSIGDITVVLERNITKSYDYLQHFG